MSREAWNLVKHAKRFYVRTYRLVMYLLVVSIFTNVGLGVASSYLYFKEPDRDFYATSGVTPPVLLTALDAPNETSYALLPSDPENESVIKVIPQ